jgi:hypothetical protein
MTEVKGYPEIDALIERWERAVAGHDADGFDISARSAVPTRNTGLCRLAAP